MCFKEEDGIRSNGASRGLEDMHKRNRSTYFGKSIVKSIEKSIVKSIDLFRKVNCKVDWELVHI